MEDLPPIVLTNVVGSHECHTQAQDPTQNPAEDSTRDQAAQDSATHDLATRDPGGAHDSTAKDLTEDPVQNGVHDPEGCKPSLSPKDAGTVIVLGILIGNGAGMLFRSEFLGSVFAMLPLVLLARHYTRKNGVPLEEAFPMKRVPLSRLLRPVPAFLCLKVVEIDILSLIDHLSGGRLTSFGELLPSASSGMSFIEVLIVTAIVAPIVEELVFRGFSYRCFTDWNIGWAAIFPSLVFACFHHPLGMPSAFMAGVFFSISAARERSLRASMLVHAVANGALTVFSNVDERLSASGLVTLLVFIHVLVVVIMVLDRRYIKGLWLEFRSLWQQFVEKPQLGFRIRILLKHWSYRILLLVIVITALTLAAIPFL